MKFGPVPVAEAEGTILAHSARLTGRVLKKGHTLSADDIALFNEEGIPEITVARLEADDIPENEAAALITAALAGENVKAGDAFTGRCNLIAKARGLLLFDTNRLNEINLIDETVTIATLPAYDLTSEGQLVATIKIIPFAISKSILDQVIAAISGQALVSIAAFKPKSIGLILTRLPGMKESILDKTHETAANRAIEFGSNIAEEIRCGHTEHDVVTAINELQSKNCDIILIFGASAVVDREDVLPAGVVQAGGRVDHFGMPVDPGNLLFIGGLGDTPVVGMPGCARSPKLNGFDWVLWRLLADVSVKREDIMLMGAGGLLKEISERGQLRQDGTGTAPAREPKIAGLLLAAGSSRRMGEENKLLTDIDGTAMVARVAKQIQKSKAEGILVVTGHEAKDVTAALQNLATGFVHNSDYADGLSTSLKAGLNALPDDIDGVIVCLGDMPLLEARHIDQLITAFDPIEGRSICVPVHGRKRGNPVLWGKQFIAEILAVTGDIGARHLLEEHADQVIEVPVDQDGVLFDVDTPERLAEFRNRST
ncbi:MAG: NTP transferase domain-containing protein [Rhodospirillaceae bacterium]|jgi:molybdenum cofactor cytidylyltransferase|nr:NTP transferase domain-containing protein [Rhodospirillaceae bacterium]MBT4590211.1 NTP transferase domain-containing protein [Rhodospirillaceae bacterium]MBT7268757.1 NTP transferase domain-containing protein [Rhodospirillaceae bacterium]